MRRRSSTTPTGTPTTGCARTPPRPRPRWRSTCSTTPIASASRPRARAAADRPRPVTITLGGRQRLQAARDCRGHLVWNASVRGPDGHDDKTPTISAMLRDRQPVREGRRGGSPGDGERIRPFPEAPRTRSTRIVRQRPDQLPEQLPHPVHRRFHQPDRAARSPRATPTRRSPRPWPPPDASVPDGATIPTRCCPISSRCAPWPTPFKWQHEGGARHAGRRRDVLLGARPAPALKNDVPSWSGKTPNDIDPTKDVAWWQHVQFSAISFGAGGHARRRQPDGDAGQRSCRAPRNGPTCRPPRTTRRCPRATRAPSRSTTCGTRR